MKLQNTSALRRNNMSALVAAACGLSSTVAGCGGSDSGSPQAPTGAWGSKVAEMDVSSTAVTFTNGCGVGTLTGPVTPDSSGNFVVTGQFPSNIPRFNERFAGHISGSTMHLVVTDPSTGDSLGTFDLTHGVTGQVTITTCP